ncbi:hypothetical protein L227DRAFT_568732, partial [Lentinus tigrinus ALCF2SS1-6]
INYQRIEDHLAVDRNKSISPFPSILVSSFIAPQGFKWTLTLIPLSQLMHLRRSPLPHPPPQRFRLLHWTCFLVTPPDAGSSQPAGGTEDITVQASSPLPTRAPLTPRVWRTITSNQRGGAARRDVGKGRDAMQVEKETAVPPPQTVPVAVDKPVLEKALVETPLLDALRLTGPEGEATPTLMELRRHEALLAEARRWRGYSRVDLIRPNSSWRPVSITWTKEKEFLLEKYFSIIAAFVPNKTPAQ